MALGLIPVGDMVPRANSFASAKGLRYWTSDATLSEPSFMSDTIPNRKVYLVLFTRNIEHIHPQIPLKFRVTVEDERAWDMLTTAGFTGDDDEEQGGLLMNESRIILASGIQRNAEAGINIVTAEAFNNALTIHNLDEYNHARSVLVHRHETRFATTILSTEGGSGAGGLGASDHATPLPHFSDAKWANKWIDIPHEPILAGDQMAIFMSLGYDTMGLDAGNEIAPYIFDIEQPQADVRIKIDLITKDFPMSNETRFWFTQRINQGEAAINLYKFAGINLL